MKKLLLLFATLCALVPAFAQNSARISIKGTIIDTLNAPLVSATVMLLTPKDSALISYGRSNEKGSFEFKNIKRGNYLLKITYVGYLPYQKELKPADAPETYAGQIKLKGISKELFEVVIKTARAPLLPLVTLSSTLGIGTATRSPFKIWCSFAMFEVSEGAFSSSNTI